MTIVKLIIDPSQQNNGFEVFTLAPANITAKSDGTLFYFPNNLYRALESKPFEEVSFMRDEMANIVWVIEDIYTNDDNVIINRHLQFDQLIEKTKR